MKFRKGSWISRKMLVRFSHWVRLLGLRGCMLFIREVIGDRAAVRCQLPGLVLPVILRLGSTDIEVAWTVLGRRDYECVPEDLNVTSIVDAGAYIGLSALYFANRFPSATIVAIEASVSNFAVLTQNVSACDRIKPLLGALWFEPGSAPLCDRKTGAWGFSLQGNNESHHLINVDCLTLPQIMDMLGWHTCDLLKLDIEGAEREVLYHSDPWIHRVQVLVAELHDRFTPGCTDAWNRATSGFSWHRKGRGLVVAGR